jgi:hypothetical protein
VSLEQVLADFREEATVLKANGHGAQADTLIRCLDAVKGGAEEYLTWLSEAEASLKSGRSKVWHRGQFANLEAQGLARWHSKRRYYRACAIPRRANQEAARMAGRRAAS